MNKDCILVSVDIKVLQGPATIIDTRLVSSFLHSLTEGEA